jgi:hypothetical protein
MNITQHNIKRTRRYRNKITNTKIITESDDETEHDVNNYKIKLNNDIDSDSDSDLESEIDIIDNSNDKQNKNNLLNIKFENYKSDLISKFIVQDKITEFNSKSILCYYLWSGIEDLDRWELNRKINLEHVKKIYKEMTKDYEKIGEFIFYEPVHLAIKENSVFYIIDGQHRLLACAKLHKKNKYPTQQIPCVLWFPKTEEEFIEIFDKINSRTPIDKTKLFNYKINEIIGWIDKTWNKDGKECLWGKTRPKINKELFVNKMRDSDTVHKLDTNQIITEIKKINSKIRGLPRNKRCDKKSVSDSVHNHAESIDFFLGYDKELGWIDDI